MQVFIEIIKKNIKLCLNYRMAFLMSLIIDPILMILNVFVFSSLYKFASVTTLAGFALDQMIWYMVGINFLWGITWNRVDYDIADKILSGDLVADLLRPLSIFKLELGEAIGDRAIAIPIQIFPPFAVLVLIYFPSFMTIGSVLAFVPVAIGSFLLCFYINFLLGLLCFAMKSMKSIWPIKALVVSGLGGGILPLSFFPQAFLSVVSVLPFQYIFYQPLRVFLNSVTQSEYIGILLFQAGWIVLLHLLTMALWHGAYKKFCAVGG